MAENNIGVVKGIMMGAGALIILTIITLIIVSTISDANLLRATASTSTVSLEQGYINETGYTLDEFTSTGRSYAISSIVNNTGNFTILVGNYTFDSTTGTVTNATTTTWEFVNITYTYIPQTTYESSYDNIGGNFTEGVDNVSGKIPTILLIASVVVLFGIIVLLVRQSREMGLGGANTSL